MSVKDYYAILQIPPHASLPEIKNAYRRLAKLYHPDKSGNDPAATARFKNICEAYEVLSSAGKKNQYLQDRWYAKASGQSFEEVSTATATDILKQCLQLNRQVSSMDPFRINRESIAKMIVQVLSDEAIDTLRAEGSPAMTEQVFELLLPCVEILGHPAQAPVMAQLYKLAGNDTNLQIPIHRVLHQSKMQSRWNKAKPLLALLVTALLCLFIYLVSR